MARILVGRHDDCGAAWRCAEHGGPDVDEPPTQRRVERMHRSYFALVVSDLRWGLRRFDVLRTQDLHPRRSFHDGFGS